MTVLYGTGVGRRRWLAALVAEVRAVRVALAISSEMWRTASRGPPTPLSDTHFPWHSSRCRQRRTAHLYRGHAVPYVLPLSYLFFVGMKAWGPKPPKYNDYGGHHSFSSLSPVSVSDVVGLWVQRFKSRRRAVKRRNHCWTIYSAMETLGIPSPQTLHAKINLKFILPPIPFVLPIFSFFKIFLRFFVHPTFCFSHFFVLFICLFFPFFVFSIFCFFPLIFFRSTCE